MAKVAHGYRQRRFAEDALPDYSAPYELRVSTLGADGQPTSVEFQTFPDKTAAMAHARSIGAEFFLG